MWEGKTSTCVERHPMPQFPPTDEQHHAVTQYISGNHVVVEALAGTGKTSTLQFMAAALPERKGLYAAFNKAIASEAARRFSGTGVLAKTMHALAFADFGAPMRHRLESRRPVLWSEKATVLGINDKYVFASGEGALSGAISRQQLVRYATDTVNAYLHSTDEQITVDHVPIPSEIGRLTAAADRRLRETIVGFANRYWADLQRTDGTLKYTHDAYLKRWALSRPQLPFDFILFDEAQDADPVITSVLLNQKSAQIIVVGDRNQAIYGWRGAENAMDAFGGIRTKLTMSFRFGDAIAGSANTWLDLLGADPELRVRGLPGKPSSVWDSQRIPEAVLTRTNGGALNEAVESQLSGVSTGIAGERKAKELRDLAQAASDLQTKKFTRHPDLEAFNTWADVVDYALSEDGGDLKPLVDVVERVGADKVVRVIDSCVPADVARTVVSTTHVSKGLEWKHVRISDDFRDPGDRQGAPKPILAEEARLAYVAVTRAIRHLDQRGLEWLPGYLARGGWVEGNPDGAQTAHVETEGAQRPSETRSGAQQ
ncbi:UvrD-helicase domain-containing protein [Microbacteriaceae bacterium K1510]|nr:UvrD-helicase domain-containing protein [Microbacteriaceae bacterium K1510]